MIDDQCWINTGEVEFLVAFLLHNQETSRCFHVIGPTIMDKVTNLYNTQATANKRELTGVEQRMLNTMFFDIQEYIDATLDIMENKFLVFLCNINNTHWISVVVVNPFLVFDKFLSQGKEDNCNPSVSPGMDDFAGWCILNSIAKHSSEQNGFIKTVHTRNNA